MPIAERLREQREVLGLSQAAMAEKCGIAARSQRNYESGERSPDADYLAALAGIGGDVIYILTGQRAGGSAVAPSPALSKREAALLDNYKHTGEEGKKVIEGTAALAAQSVGASKRV